MNAAPKPRTLTSRIAVMVALVPVLFFVGIYWLMVCSILSTLILLPIAFASAPLIIITSLIFYAAPAIFLIWRFLRKETEQYIPGIRLAELIVPVLTWTAAGIFTISVFSHWGN